MFSPSEYKMIEAYDKATEDQARKDKKYADRPLTPFSLKEVYEALEAEALDNIREAHSEIGVMLKCRDRFKTQAIGDLTNYFIFMAKYLIEEEHNDVARWRKESKGI